MSEVPIEERVRELTANYSNEAEVYQRVWAPGLREAGQRLLTRLSIAPDARVLDIGAGVGALLPDIAAVAPRGTAIGVDRSEGMIARAPAASPIAVMDAMQLGFREASIDAAVALFVLFHLPDPLIGLREIERVLRPGGVVGIATWGEGDEDWPALEVWRDELDRFGAAPPQPLLSQHELVDTPEALEGLFVGAGLTRSEIWIETMERQWDAAGVEKFASGMAVSKRRFDSLEPSVQAMFLDEARRRLGGLSRADFVHKAPVLFATAAAG